MSIVLESLSSIQTVATAIGASLVGKVLRLCMLEVTHDAPKKPPPKPAFDPTMPARRAEGAFATEFRIEAIDTNPHPLLGGPRVLRLQDEGAANVPLAELFAMENAVLYCVEIEDPTGAVLIWLEVPDTSALCDAPFLDRAVRKLAKLGGRAWVAKRTAVDAALPELVPDAPSWTVTFIWNTGRCGSTLLHRALSASGAVCSLSEPMWMDQLASPTMTYKRKLHMAGLAPPPPPGPPAKGDEGRGALLRTCTLVHCAHARRFMMPPETRGTTLFSVNPKAMGYHAIPLFLKEFDASNDSVPKGLAPAAMRHVLMYRNGVEVVDSFHAFVNKAKPLPWWPALMNRYGLDGGGPDPPPKPPPSFFCSTAMRTTCPEPPRITQPASVRFMFQWADIVNYFNELLTSPPYNAAGTSQMAVMSVHFDVVTWQGESAPKLAAVEKVLAFAGVKVSPKVMERVCPTLNEDSQRGKKAGAVAGALKVLTPNDVSALESFCAATPLGSANPALPETGNPNVSPTPKTAEAGLA